MLRGHPANDAIATAGVRRMLELADSSEEAARSVIDAGAVEWICAQLRQSTAAQATPSATLSSALGGQLLVSPCGGAATQWRGVREGRREPATLLGTQP